MGYIRTSSTVPRPPIEGQSHVYGAPEWDANQFPPPEINTAQDGLSSPGTPHGGAGCTLGTIKSTPLSGTYWVTSGTTIQRSPGCLQSFEQLQAQKLTPDLMERLYP